MPNMKQYKFGRAKAYFLQNPDASISQCARDADVSERTAAQAHSELVAEGHLRKSRKSAPTTVVGDPEAAVPLSGDLLLTDKTLTVLAEGEMGDLLDLDDETVRKKLLKRVIGIALDPNAHPDSALSAATIWGKLKEMARVADLGPGKPMNRADAIERHYELDRAVGLNIAMNAMVNAFGVQAIVDFLSAMVKETSNGEEAAVDASAPAGATEDSGAPDNGAAPTEAQD